MALLQDLIAQIADPTLRERILLETNKLLKQKKFGLVFEDHLPECTPLYDVPVRVGSTVALKTGPVSDLHTVLNLEGKEALCEHRETRERKTFQVDELVVSASFGEPIYPYLKQVETVCNAPDSSLWHTLIEADNYHALQLLEYLYAGKVDCIYIDPPYNTGARDWKYNNDYVDASDAYRHSKWLSMMEKRLKIAKKLLNPKDSVLIVTIDEKEYLHLGCLLEEMFPNANIQMVSTVINPANVSRYGGFGRSCEYIFFVMFGISAPLRTKLSREWVSSKGRTHTGNVRWDLLKRSGTSASRQDSPGGFYPVYINTISNKIEYVGEPLPEGVSVPPEKSGLFALLPIRNNGSEGRWQWTKETFIERMKQGRVRIGGNIEKGYTIYILKDGEFEKVKHSEFQEIGRGINNEILTEEKDNEYVMAIPGDIWKISSHDATQYGSRLLVGNYFPDRRFTFPKSLYAVHDTIRFFVANKPHALIVDFFAGSGTTLHAVNLLNAGDGGARRCILVTNNEVSDDEAKALKKQGFKPGDEAWEQLGIARYVTWPRTVCSIEGHDVNGAPLKGNYLGSDIPMAAGFKANAVYFKLGFLDKTLVALDTQFKELLSVLWMKAGAIGPCPTLTTDELPDMLILPENRFAVLLEEAFWPEFATRLTAHPEIQTVFLVTDSDATYKEMTRELEEKVTYQLYKDYLENFRINRGR